MSVGQEQHFWTMKGPSCRADAVLVEETRATPHQRSVNVSPLASVLYIQRASTERTVQLHRWLGPDPPERLSTARLNLVWRCVVGT